MQKYSKKVLEHFTKPHNQGKIKNADGIGTVGNPKCGDIMRLYIKVSKDKQGQEIIKDVKFETLGCGAAISTSSMTTDLAKGKTLEQALEITNKSVAEELGGLPSAKMHCSNLAADALHAAIKNYKTKK
ncbi:MAG: Fe-S cluster assembly scaffold protein NifU [Candidatus Moranbacteria bacterium]|nr:Fe-S cluster assembly scaffold protein NifU [Candidatus Moranbacteria bacterium]